MLEFQSQKFRNEVSAYLQSIIDYEPNTQLAIFLQSIIKLINTWGSKNALFFLYRVSPMNYVYHFRVKSILKLRFEIIADTEVLATDMVIDFLKSLTDLYFAVLENKGIKLDNRELEISRLSKLAMKMGENFKEISSAVSLLPGVNFYEKIAAIIKILENNEQPHNLKRLLQCENFMQIFHEHGLISDSMEPQRFWKLFHIITAALFNLSKGLNFNALFTTMDANCEKNLYPNAKKIESLRNIFQSFITYAADVSTPCLVMYGCEDLLERNDSSILQWLKTTLKKKFLSGLVHNAFFTIDKEKSTKLFNNIYSINDQALKDLLMDKYHELFKKEDNLDSTAVPGGEMPFMPAYLMIKDAPEFPNVEPEQHKTRKYSGLTHSEF